MSMMKVHGLFVSGRERCWHCDINACTCALLKKKARFFCLFEEAEFKNTNPEQGTEKKAISRLATAVLGIKLAPDIPAGSHYRDRIRPIS